FRLVEPPRGLLDRLDRGLDDRRRRHARQNLLPARPLDVDRRRTGEPHLVRLAADARERGVELRALAIAVPLPDVRHARALGARIAENVAMLLDPGELLAYETGVGDVSAATAAAARARAASARLADHDQHHHDDRRQQDPAEAELDPPLAPLLARVGRLALEA